MGFLDTMKMYMKVDGVSGDVVKPPAYLGWIEIDGLDWPHSGAAPRPPINGNSQNPMATDADGMFLDYPDFPDKPRKTGDVTVRSVRAFTGKYSTQVFLMVQQATRTNVAIWVPMPHSKLLKAQLSGVIVSAYTMGGRGDGSPSIERITFNAASGRLRAAP